MYENKMELESLKILNILEIESVLFSDLWYFIFFFIFLFIFFIAFFAFKSKTCNFEYF
jgi:hypothetical protein